MGTKKYRRDTLIEAGLLFSLFYLPGYLFLAGIPDPRSFNSLLYNLQIWILLVPQIFMVIYLMHRDDLLDFQSFGLVRPGAKDIPFILLAAAGTAAVVMAVQVTIMLVAGEVLPEEPLWKLTKYSMIAPVFISSLLTGYSEELFFRSYLYTRLEVLDTEKWSRLIFVNILFAAGHLYEGVPGGFNAFILGCYFSFLFTRKKNIHIPAILHGLYNFSALLLTLFL
ncbi:CPBP family intramembrane glutamic endopeptidase [Spirochaeta isovalerica]|uniref:CAAX prenyl protease 2/Lysostaphin resistance protein A-like domain-containing protein n=1 Tax=Spirochaeta isovalerica TaxID=150 RepID=A0A841R9N1_9SPIO|nr:type II CAAX endopeptidase family protein [Spirochaeta isovalerica]MBB6480615.1 hypothetical protein [Spirochaeta isovalerica]